MAVADIPLPMSVVMVFALDLITDIAPAIAYAHGDGVRITLLTVPLYVRLFYPSFTGPHSPFKNKSTPRFQPNLFEIRKLFIHVGGRHSAAGVAGHGNCVGLDRRHCRYFDIKFLNAQHQDPLDSILCPKGPRPSIS